MQLWRTQPPSPAFASGTSIDMSGTGTSNEQNEPPMEGESSLLAGLALAVCGGVFAGLGAALPAGVLALGAGALLQRSKRGALGESAREDAPKRARHDEPKSQVNAAAPHAPATVIDLDTAPAPAPKASSTMLVIDLTDDAPVAVSPAAGPMAGKPVVLRADTDYLLEEKDVDIDHKAIIGEGGFGQVFRGKLHGITDVAVKKCRTWRAHGEARDYFRDELLAWARMPPRPNVVPLLGYHLNPDFLVTRYYPHCNLKKYLAGKGWPVRESLKLLHDAAKGMVFIHASHIVHSDLKAENVLVDVDSGDHATALVTDFGLAKRRVKFESGESRYEGARGFSLHFAAPELLTPRGATKPSSDVWSFGMMCYQVLMCGALPYANRGTDHVIRYAISRGEHPTLESAFRIPPALRELMVCCWDFTPERRPTMAEVERRLCQIWEDYEEDRDATLSRTVSN